MSIPGQAPERPRLRHSRGQRARRQRRAVEPLSRINDITFSHSLLERVLGTGTLVIESAGERGQVVLADVPNVEQVQRKVYDLVEDTDERLRAGQHSTGPDGG